MQYTYKENCCDFTSIETNNYNKDNVSKREKTLTRVVIIIIYVLLLIIVCSILLFYVWLYYKIRNVSIMITELNKKHDTVVNKVNRYF